MSAKYSEFDQQAKTWDDMPDRILRSQVIAESIMDAIPNNPSFTAMEYGCGTGLLSFPLKDHFSHITLIDNSKGMLDVLNEKIKQHNAKNMEVMNIDLLDASVTFEKSFSVIYSSMVLHHILDIKKILSVWRSLLTTPGYLCIADLDSDKGMFHGPEFKGNNGFDRDSLKATVIEAGFSSVIFKTIYKIRKPCRDGIERTFPIFFMIAEKSE